jgi:hypothetical protein
MTSCLRNSLTALAFALVAAAAAVTQVHGQAAQGAWSPPLNLFETAGRASEAEVVADRSGAVHVFWAYAAPTPQGSEGAQAIYYARLQDGAWSEPVDVLVSPGARVARMPSVASDDAGYLHVVWSASDAIYYSRAYAPEAGSARGWTWPTPLVGGVSALDPAIAAGPDNTLYAVWTQALAGLVFARSEDGGRNWSSPEIIFEASADTELARWGRVAVDGAGRLHVVLTHTTIDPTGRYGLSEARFLYYLRSEDRGATWSDPLLVTPEPDFGEINVATFGEDTVHLAWNGRAGHKGRYHQWSPDGGRTWSNTTEVLAPDSAAGDAGLTGFPALVTDASGVLHMVTTGGGGDYYLHWADGSWSQPVLVSPGVSGRGVTGESASLEQPSIALSEGNRLHVVFHDGFQRIWYTGSEIDAPHRDGAPLPAPTVAPTAAATAPPSPTPRPSAVLQPAAELDAAGAAPAGASPGIPLLVGILPAFLLVAGVLVFYQARRPR